MGRCEQRGHGGRQDAAPENQLIAAEPFPDEGQQQGAEDGPTTMAGEQETEASARLPS
jgi:hypothetical protein